MSQKKNNTKENNISLKNEEVQSRGKFDTINKPYVQKEQYFENTLSVSRVTKVVEGGRIFSFSACVVVGNKKGLIGFAKGKASEANDARDKGVSKAKKHLIKVPLYQGRTIHHDIVGTNGSTKILLRRAKAGKGIIAGPTARSILTLCGLKDVVAKAHGSSNVHTTVRAIFDALSKLNTPANIAKKRGKLISEISITQSAQE